MGNTVGSQRNLTSKQKEVLIGTLLGDGILELNGRYPRLRVDHGARQKAYVEWKYKIFHNLAAGGIKYFYQRVDHRTKKRYTHCKSDTISTPLLNEFYKTFYVNRKKRIPDNIIRILNKPLSLAVWFMDDGYKRNDCNALRISTDSFALEGQRLLLECLKKNFGICAKLHKKGKFWNIYIPNPEAKNFCKIIEPYIIPGMRYKISFDPVTTEVFRPRW